MSKGEHQGCGAASFFTGSSKSWMERKTTCSTPAQRQFPKPNARPICSKRQETRYSIPSTLKICVGRESLVKIGHTKDRA